MRYRVQDLGRRMRGLWGIGYIVYRVADLGSRALNPNLKLRASLGLRVQQYASVLAFFKRALSRVRFWDLITLVAFLLREYGFILIPISSLFNVFPCSLLTPSKRKCRAKTDLKTRRKGSGSKSHTVNLGSHFQGSVALCIVGWNF